MPLAIYSFLIHVRQIQQDIEHILFEGPLLQCNRSLIKVTKEVPIATLSFLSCSMISKYDSFDPALFGCQMSIKASISTFSL